MYHKPTIMKFGGTSVEDANAFARVAQIVAAHRQSAPPVVIVSAMSRMTDALLGSVKLAASGAPVAASQALDPHFERHAGVARELLATEEAAAIDDARQRSRRDIAALLHQISARLRPHLLLQDEVVSYGERLSAMLLAALLRASALPARYVDARRCIITDDEHGCAMPLWPETERSTRAEIRPLLAVPEIPVLGGFIGASPSGVTTTLGRGGSDYTAALVGAALLASEVQIWTDVTGVFTADPRLIKEARTIPYLSYLEAAQLAHCGAKVLHPKTIQPAAERNIPVSIRNSRAPQEPGTLVCSETSSSPHRVKGITHKAGLTLLHVTSTHLPETSAFVHTICGIFNAHRTPVSVLAISETCVSLSLGETHALPFIIHELEQLGEVTVEPRRALIGIIGDGLRTGHGVTARVFNSLSEVNVSMISQGAATGHLSFVIDEARVGEVIKRLHDAFFTVEAEEQNAVPAAVLQRVMSPTPDGPVSGAPLLSRAHHDYGWV